MDDQGRISAEMAAKLLMITPRHLRRLVADGWIAKSESDRYTLIGAVQGRIKQLEAKIKEGAASAHLNATNKARAREIELRIAMKERELIRLTEALSIVDALSGMFRATLEGLPARLTRDLDLRREYEQVIRSDLVRLSKLSSETASTLRTGEPDPDPVEEDDAGSMGEGQQDLPG